MKKLVAALIALSAATVTAEENYGVPNQFRVLTPEEVQVDVALNGYAGSCEYGVYEGAILEPVIIKCINGAPGYYYVYTFNGTDPGSRDAIERIRYLLSNGDGFYLEEISPLLDTARDNHKDYCTFGYDAWDFGWMLFKTATIDSLLYEFETYAEVARKCLDIEGPAKIKLYVDAPFRSSLIFALTEEGKEEKFMRAVGYTGWVLDEEGHVKEYAGYAETSRKEITAQYNEKIEQLRSVMSEKGDNIDSNVNHWEETREKTGAIEKEDGYYHIIVPEPE